VSLWRQLTHGLRALSRPAAADQDIADEVESYFQEAAAAFEASGMSKAKAQQAARRALGNASLVREQVRSYGWEYLLETLLADLRYGARRLKADRGFTLVSVTTLALGIGASTAIFSAVNPILFQSLPYPHPERVLTIWDYGRDGTPLELTFGSYHELSERSHSFQALAATKPWQPTLTGVADAERLEGQRVTAAYFHVLGITALVGRDFDPSEDQPKSPNVAIISDGLLRRRFGGDPAMVGRTITLDDERFTIVGIMPPGFENIPRPAAEIWAPLQYDTTLPGQGREWGHHLRMVARMRPGVDLAAARKELVSITESAVPQFQRPPWASMGRGLIVQSLQDEVTSGVKPALLAVLAAVLLVLALACVNVTNLLLGRGVQRRGEFAMRAALGAERTRLVRQLVTESLLLAALGGAIGAFVATLGIDVLVALAPQGLPRADAIDVNLQALGFALAITAVVGVAAGLIPALQSSRTDLRTGLLRGARSVAGGPRLARRALVILEVALTLVLLIGAGLLLRSLQHLFAISPGFETSHLLTMQVQLSGRRFDKVAADRFLINALEAVQRVPGVVTAGFTSQLPLSGERSEFGVAQEPSGANPVDPGFPAFRYAVSPSYFETLELPLRRGRLLDSRDKAGAPRAALVSQSLAKNFPDGDPIGRRVYIGPTDREPFEVVGVVGDVRQMSLAANETDAVYVTPAQWYFVDSTPSLVVRTRGDAGALTPAIKAAIRSVDHDQPIVRIATVDELIAATAAERRFALILFEAFGLAALVIAAIGLYGLLAGMVAERRRELGIRSALGASRTNLVGLVVREAMSLMLVGVTAGVVLAVVATRGLSTLLFAVSHLDLSTYLGGMALLIVTAALACFVPGWRAARLDPTITLTLE
jgi:putative ABC transport system permease protein